MCVTERLQSCVRGRGRGGGGGGKAFLILSFRASLPLKRAKKRYLPKNSSSLVIILLLMNGSDGIAVSKEIYFLIFAF